MDAPILKPDTDMMLLKSDVTYRKLSVVPKYNNANIGHQNRYFQNKSIFTNFIE